MRTLGRMATRDLADDAPDETAAVEADDKGALKIVGVAAFDVSAPAELEPDVEDGRIGGVLDAVAIGDSDGDAARIARILGMGDSVTYTEWVAAGVKERQVAAGLEPDGAVDTAATWALILPVLRHGDHGPEVGTLRVLLGLPSVGQFDDEVESGVRFAQAEHSLDRTGVCDGELWLALLEGGAA